LGKGYNHRFAKGQTAKPGPVRRLIQPEPEIVEQSFEFNPNPVRQVQVQPQAPVRRLTRHLFGLPLHWVFDTSYPFMMGMKRGVRFYEVLE
jgi:hypothetical protein